MQLKLGIAYPYSYSKTDCQFRKENKEQTCAKASKGLVFLLKLLHRFVLLFLRSSFGNPAQSQDTVKLNNVVFFFPRIVPYCIAKHWELFQCLSVFVF